ncbi:MAG: 2OG-Fe(II) oxygenase, partial [Xanthomonadales bacterium]|nr:2OG-Fe(II) oxygenase [Xanthomonadales bacterium]
MNASIAPTQAITASMLNPALTQRLDAIAARFRDAKPFRHVVIDDFFTPQVATSLLEHFPAFERGNAMTENGTLGHKSTVEQIRELGPVYAALDDAIQSPAFLTSIERITGIPELLYDPYYFGGGTHENRTGQDLDPHIDFNRHPAERWHRRLNLIVYLNHEWHDTWGGSLELHSDPHVAEDQVSLVTPLFNRAVIFETTEDSWHGFSRIQLPQDKADWSRKSIALY